MNSNLKVSISAVVSGLVLLALYLLLMFVFDAGQATNSGNKTFPLVFSLISIISIFVVAVYFTDLRVFSFAGLVAFAAILVAHIVLFVSLHMAASVFLSLLLAIGVILFSSDSVVKENIVSNPSLVLAIFIVEGLVVFGLAVNFKALVA